MMAALACSPIQIKHNPETPLVEADQRILLSAVAHCDAMYHQSNPCLVSFEKTEEGVFRAICGPAAIEATTNVKPDEDVTKQKDDEDDDNSADDNDDSQEASND
jgi:hypothetical protein